MLESASEQTVNVNLTTELLRNLVAIADAGSMSKAAEQVNLTQSALSLQMKRLADLVGMPIFHRHHRGMSLTPAGKTLLSYGRMMIELNDRAVSSLVGETMADPIRIGVTDSAELLLIKVLPRIARAYPGAELQIGVASSSELLNQLSGGLHDIVVCLGNVDDRAAIATSQMEWVGSPKLCLEPQLPIVVMRKPCIYRDAAIASLERANRDYRIVLEAPTFFVLRAAVLAGIGLTCRSGPFFLANLEPLADVRSPLPSVAYCLHTAPVHNLAVLRTAEIIRSVALNMQSHWGGYVAAENPPAQNLGFSVAMTKLQ